MNRYLSSISLGVIYSVLAALFFSFMGAFTKYAAQRIPTVEVVFVRSLISTIVIVFMMIRKKRPFWGPRPVLLFLRGLFGTIGLYGFFYMISQIKLGDAAIIMHLSPIFVVVFSSIFLKERMPRNFYYLLALAFIGSIFVIKPNLSNLRSIAALIGVCASVMAGAAYVCVKSLSKDHNTQLIVLSFMTLSLLSSAPLSYLNLVIPTGFELFALIMVGLTSVVAQLFLTKAYKIEKAGIVAITGYIGLFFNILWGFMFWKEMLDIYSVIGGAMILFACGTLALTKKK